MIYFLYGRRNKKFWDRNLKSPATIFVDIAQRETALTMVGIDTSMSPTYLDNEDIHSES